MSSVVDPQPEQSPADELVAYLDGELSPEECRRVEARLAVDAGYRQQLHDLDQAWEALDVLPARKTNDDFARTTMELVAIAAQGDASAATVDAANAKRRRVAWFSLAALAGTLLGFVAAWLLLPNHNRALLRDLPVIRQVDVLQQVESVEFVRRLAAEVPEDRLMNDQKAIDDELVQLKAAGAPALSERRKWVEALSPEDKVVLAAQAKRFGDLSRIEGEQDRLRVLERQIEASGIELQRTLLAYDQWLSRLTAAQKEELRENLLDRSIDDQVKLIGRLARQEKEQASRRLTPQDAEKLRDVLREIAKERQAEIADGIRRRGDKDRPRRMEGGTLPLLARELFKGDEDNRLRDRLESPLSAEARAHLDSLSGIRRTGQLWRWILDSLQMKVDSDELERFFADKLTNDQREDLLSLPPDEMQSRLERLYYATELGGGGVAQWWGQYRESSGGPPGPGRPDFRPDGPRDRRRPDGPMGNPPPEFDRRGPGPGEPGGPPPPRDGRFPGDGRPPQRQGPPPDGPPRDGPPPGPPPGDIPQETI